MKKTLLLIFSLLIFVGNVWGWNATNTDLSGIEKDKSKGVSFNKSCPQTMSFTLSNVHHLYDCNVNVTQYTSATKSTVSKATEVLVYKGNISNNGTDCTIELASSTRYVEFTNKTTRKKTFGISPNLTVSNISYFGIDASFSIDNVSARDFGTKTIKTQSEINVTVSYSASTKSVTI